MASQFKHPEHSIVSRSQTLARIWLRETKQSMRTVLGTKL